MLNNNTILKVLLSQNPQMEKYTKTSENQDLNDFLQETLAWINYRRR